MGIRIQPKEIIISDDSRIDPFEKDMLSCKESVEFPAHIISSIEGPSTIRHNGFNHCYLT